MTGDKLMWTGWASKALKLMLVYEIEKLQVIERLNLNDTTTVQIKVKVCLFDAALTLCS